METAYFWDDQVPQYRPPLQPTELDYSWKLTPYAGVPMAQKYCRLPYIMVFRRKQV